MADEQKREGGRFTPGNKPVNRQGTGGRFERMPGKPTRRELREAARGGRLERQIEEKRPTPEVIALADKAARSKITTLESENARLRKLLGVVEGYHAGAAAPPPWLAPEPGKTSVKDKLAVACMQLSDLHLDEVVDPAQVGGLNAFNREIGEMRLKRWADKACELGDMYQHRWEGCVLLIEGDLVSGAIHEELVASNEDVLPSTIIYWAPLLAAAIKQVADFYGRMHICTVVGNHGRLTQKKQAKNRGRNSWDWLLGELIKSHLRESEHITWDVSQGSYLFVPVYKQTLYCTHLDEVHGGGGWSGIWSPLGTAHRRGIELAVSHGIQGGITTCGGHWHQLTLAHHRGLVVNGSLKGWDEYAACLRLRPEPAMQSWWVVTPTHGTTLAAPVLVEDRKTEGW